jgi:hypothetical protein
MGSAQGWRSPHLLNFVLRTTHRGVAVSDIENDDPRRSTGLPPLDLEGCGKPPPRHGRSRGRAVCYPGRSYPHDPAHADMPHEVTVIKGRRFPTCRHCKGIRFEFAHPAKHVGEIDYLEEAHAPAH